MNTNDGHPFETPADPTTASTARADARSGRAPPLAVALTGAAALAAAVASAAGVFFRGDLATVDVATPRGEHVDLLVRGAYRFNSKRVAAEGVGWDAVTLFLVVPVLLVLLPGVRRGSLRATLAATGVLAYLLYQYLEYATYLAYGPLFLVYIAAFALSGSGIAVLLSRLDLRALPTRFGPGFPRRAVIGLGGFMAVLLCAMWLPMVARTAAGGGRLFGATTLVVQALDLGLLVPLGVFTAVSVYRRRPVGFVLAGVVAVKAAAMAAAICAMLGFEAHATGRFEMGPFAVFAATACASLYLVARVYGSIDAGRGTESGTAATARHTDAGAGSPS